MDGKRTANIFTRRMSWLQRVNLQDGEADGNSIVTTTVGGFLDPHYQKNFLRNISAIRELCTTIEAKDRNKERISELKLLLPAGIMSGVVDGGISERNVTELNSIVCIDIDGKDNPALYDWKAVKAEVGKSPYVAYAGLSVSGQGIFVLIPIQDATKHKQHYQAIANDFTNKRFIIHQGNDTEPTVIRGIQIDTAPSSIASKRFISYDPSPYFNTEAQIYSKTYEPKKLWVPGFYSRCKGGKFNLEEFLQNHNIPYNIRERHGGVQYVVSCPWADLHSSRSHADSAVFVYPDGKLGYKCMHAHCAEKHWREFREYYEKQ